MKLKLTIDKLEDVPEAQRALYEPADGKFRLSIDGYEDPAGLKSALQKERDAAKSASQKAKEYEALGLSAEEVKALVDAKKKADDEAAHKAGDFEKLKSQLNDSHAKALKAEQDKVESMRAAMQRTLIEGAAARAIAEAKGSAQLLLPHVKAQTKTIEDNGEFKVVVVDAKGDPRINGKGDPMTVAELVGEMRTSDVFGRAFEGTGAGGGGMPPGGGGTGGKVVKRAAFEALPPAAKAQHMRDGYTVAD